MDKGVPYCLLHNYIVKKDKVIPKCRGNKPMNTGLSYKRTGKSSDNYRCKYLIYLKDIHKQENQ